LLLIISVQNPLAVEFKHEARPKSWAIAPLLSITMRPRLAPDGCVVVISSVYRVGEIKKIILCELS
jgi:hypothetical protein